MWFNPAETEGFVLGCPGVCLLNSPMQKVPFLPLYNMETFYLELLFLSGKTVYCRVLCLWEGVWQQVHGVLLGSVFLVSTGSEQLSSSETHALGVQDSPLPLPCCAYERRGVSTEWIKHCICIATEWIHIWLSACNYNRNSASLLNLQSLKVSALSLWCLARLKSVRSGLLTGKYQWLSNICSNGHVLWKTRTFAKGPWDLTHLHFNYKGVTEKTAY